MDWNCLLPRLRQPHLGAETAGRGIGKRQVATVKLHDFRHDGETEAGSRFRLVETLTAFQGRLPILLRQTGAIVFDTLFATSCKNDTPQQTPQPYDRDRDGLVIGEGASALILEEREHAVARGAPILAELVGFGFVDGFVRIVGYGTIHSSFNIFD